MNTQPSVPTIQTGNGHAGTKVVMHTALTSPLIYSNHCDHHHDGIIEDSIGCFYRCYEDIENMHYYLHRWFYSRLQIANGASNYAYDICVCREHNVFVRIWPSGLLGYLINSCWLMCKFDIMEGNILCHVYMHVLIIYGNIYIYVITIILWYFYFIVPLE